MFFCEQSKKIFSLLEILLNNFSPHPIAAAMLNSEHRIDIWELDPPYFVIKPLILY